MELGRGISRKSQTILCSTHRHRHRHRHIYFEKLIIGRVDSLINQSTQLLKIVDLGLAIIFVFFPPTRLVEMIYLTCLLPFESSFKFETRKLGKLMGEHRLHRTGHSILSRSSRAWCCPAWFLSRDLLFYSFLGPRKPKGHRL